MFDDIQEAYFKIPQKPMGASRQIPEKNKNYKGYITFCAKPDGEAYLIDYHFANLERSSWLQDAVLDFVIQNAKKDRQLYRFEGTLCNCVFHGQVRELFISI